MSTNFKELKKNIQIGKYDPIPEFYSENLNYLIENLLKLDPNERSSAEYL